MKRAALFLFIMLGAVLAPLAKNPQDYSSQKAEESISLGRYDEALGYARQEIADYDANPNGYYQAALCHYALHQPGQALSMLNIAIGKAKKNKLIAAKCYLAKAQILNELNDSIQALDTLNKGLKVDGKNVELLAEHALMLIGHDNKGAEKDLQKMKKVAPADERGWAYTAYLRTLDGRYHEALDEVNRAIDLNGRDQYSYGLRSGILRELGRSPEWIDDGLRSYDLAGAESLGMANLMLEIDAATRKQIIDRIESKRSLSNDYHIIEGALLYMWRDYEAAAKLYEEVIAMGRGSKDIYFGLAACQKELERFFEAYTTATNGLTLFPNDMSLKYIKVQIGVIAGKGLDVMDIIDGMIAESPEDVALYEEKGKAYMSLGYYTQALEPLATAVMLAPSSLNRMYYGDALRLSGDTVAAAKQYNDILNMSADEIALEPQTPFYMYAMAYSGLGRRDDALAAIDKMKESNPDAVNYLTIVYGRLGDKDKVLAYIADYAKNHDWGALLDLYTYDLHFLHSDPRFAEMLAKEGVGTKVNAATGLLEYEPEALNFSSGGTSYDDASQIVAENPDDWVRAMNDACPIDMGIGGQLMSVGFNPLTRTVTYNCVINPMFLDFEAVNAKPSYKDKKTDMIALGVINNDPSIANMDYIVEYIVKANDGSGECTFLITPARVKRIKRTAGSPDEMDRMLLDFWAEEEAILYAKHGANIQVSFDGNVLSYTYSISESDGQFAQIELFKSDVKKQVASGFTDPSMQVRNKVYLRRNVTVKFIYQGDISGRKIEIVFTPDELKEYVK